MSTIWGQLYRQAPLRRSSLIAFPLDPKPPDLPASTADESQLPATQQIALALRIVSGLTVEQIARAFLVSPVAMEQRITRAKRVIAQMGVEFDTPGAGERRTRLAVLKELNMPNEARSALNRAIALANSVAEAKLIRRELDSLGAAPTARPR